jgi:hypothetical protein
MLDSRVYRAAFLPVLLAVIVAAFALGERPRPIGTTLAPEAFDPVRAGAVLRSLAGRFPDRRPGGPGDAGLAAEVERTLRGDGFDVRLHRIGADTVDGERTLTTVVGERAGRDNRRIVVVAQRDAAGRPGLAELSGTAALLELSRLFRGRATRRTLTLVSTSGATGGQAGARRLVDQLPGPIDAVLVLGDLASSPIRQPIVVPWADDGGMAPLRLRRTVEDALRVETGIEGGSPRALAQLARLGVPLTLTSQGPIDARGVPAVTVQASGERGPASGAGVSPDRFEGLGRGVLRSISALDNGPDVEPGPRPYLVVQRRLLPSWTVRLLAGLLLLPAVVAAIDGLARVRRRRRPVLPWIRWLLAGALVFAATASLVRLLGLTGLLPSPPGPADPDALPVEAVGLLVPPLVLALLLVLRPSIAAALRAPRGVDADSVPGAAAALAVVLALLAVAVWVVNPFTALLLAPAVHLWLLAAVPEVRTSRAVSVGLVGLGVVPFALVAAYYAQAFGLDPLELVWMFVVLLSGGYAGAPGMLVWSALLACGLGAGLIALAKRPREDVPEDVAPVSTRGPASYAGPGSLGGTESALRR